MERDPRIEVGWGPRRGSYEESVLSWYEQVGKAFAKVPRAGGLEAPGGRRGPVAKAQPPVRGAEQVRRVSGQSAGR